MSLQITQRPVVNIGGGNTSRWVSAYFPIIFSGRRMDFDVIQLINQTNKLRIQTFKKINNIDVITGVVVAGDTIYISAGIYTVQATVTAVDTTDTTYAYITTDLDYVTNTYTGGGYFNLLSKRKNFHYLLELYKIVDGEFLLSSKYIFRHLPDGSFNIDLSAMVARGIIFKNKFPYHAPPVNERDIDLSGGVNFRIKEVWQGSSNDFFPFSDDNRIYFVAAAKQLKDKYGSNMGEYVMPPANINLYNGSFDISSGDIGWVITNISPNTTTTGATMSITGGQLITNIPADIKPNIGVKMPAAKTALQNGKEYAVIIDVAELTNCRFKIYAGTTTPTEISLAGLSKRVITSAGTEFQILVESIDVNLPSTAKLNAVRIYETVGASTAKFLTEKFEPTYFKDFPFDISFIHAETTHGLLLKRVVKFLNINKQAISTTEGLLTISQNEFAVNRLSLGSVPVNTKFMELSIYGDDPVLSTSYIPTSLKEKNYSVAQTVQYQDPPLPLEV